jgi:two-component system, OmpR family, response regulator
MMAGLMRVLIVDDHREVLELVERALSRDQHQVFTADSAERALEELGARNPDIIVLDLGLPDGSGEDLCRTIRSTSDSPAILVLTAQSAVASRVRCLDAGADDYLTKPFAVAELRARVRALSRRTQAAGPRLWQRGGLALDFAARRASLDQREAPITAREWAILECLARAAGRVVPRQQLLEQVWARADAASAASLEVLIGRIRRKLGSDVVRTLRGGGYALADD